MCLGSQVTPESLAEWSSRHAHLNEVGSFLLESTEPRTSRNLAEELRRLNAQWTEFVTRNTVVSNINLQFLLRISGQFTSCQRSVHFLSEVMFLLQMMDLFGGTLFVVLM